jgi:hypothetical protein
MFMLAGDNRSTAMQPSAVLDKGPDLLRFAKGRRCH